VSVRIQIYLNDTFGGSFAKNRHGSGDRSVAYRRVTAAVEADPAVQAITSRSRERRPGDGYEHGDTVAESILHFEADGGDYMKLAWDAVAYANRDDRANGEVERSFSAGDVLRVTTDDGSTLWLASTGTNLVPIGTPAEILR
jgi:hypothetical protein